MRLCHVTNDSIDQMGTPPRISIVTPSFNQADYLEECIRSVRDQGYPGSEHIVVDGGSNDGSRTIIERHAQSLAWWCAEADNGQSHAINKGMARATGEVLGWINSDDLLLPGALHRVGDAFAADPSLMVLSGVRLLRAAGRHDEPMPMEHPSDRDAWLTRPRVNQQATFYRLDALRAIGGVEEGLRFVMDYELWIQAVLRFPSAAIRIVPTELAVFRHHAASKTMTSQPAFVDEIASVLHGLSQQAGLTAQAHALATGHRITAGLRRAPVEQRDAGLVSRMAWRFMLKWHHQVYSPSEHAMMRAWIRFEPPPDFLDADELRRLSQLRDDLRQASWPLFRLRRKIKHLLG